MDSRSASSPPQPSILFTCPENSGLASSSYAQGQQQLRHDHVGIDVHLKVGETKLAAHRLVLMNSSPVLMAMLSRWNPERNDICELGEDVVDPNIAGDLLDFFYLRRVTITLANAKQLCIAADYLHLSTLKVATDQFLADYLQFSSDDIFGWLNFTEMYKLDSLRKPCTKVVFENYRTVLKRKELLESPEKLLEQLLNDLKVFGSSIVNRAMFGLLIQWIKFDITTRADSLLNILEMFPFLEVSESFITNTVLKEELITNSQDCLELVNNSLNELSSLLKEKHLYYVGEYVNHLDVASEKWTRKSSMNHSRGEHFCSAASGDKIYIFGGDFKAAEVFDTKNDRWTDISSMPVRRSYAAAVAMNGYIYLCGGFGEKLFIGSVDRYCMATNEWTSMAPMLKIRYRYKMIAFNDSIFAIGGDFDSFVKTVEKFSPEANQWEMVPAFELLRGDFTALHNGKFFTFNLYRDHLIDNIDTVNVYDPLTDSMETFQDSGAVEVLKFDAVPTCVSVGDKIWALDYRKGIFGEFDPVTRKWKKLDIDMSILRDTYYEVIVPQR